MATEIKKNSYTKIKQTIFAYLTDAFLWTYLVLISYKIIYQKLIARLWRADFEWVQVTYCLIIGVAVASVFYFIKGASIGKNIQKISDGGHKKASQKISTWLGGLLIVTTIITGFEIAQVSFYEFFNTKALLSVQRIFTALFKPNPDIFETTVFAAIETIYMALMATVFAIPVAFLISFPAAKNLMNSSRMSLAIYGLVRFLLNFTRAIEPLVWAIIFSVWVGIGPFAGSLALALHSVSSLAKLYSEQIENINDGPIEAMKATGASNLLVIWHGVVPQVLIPYMSFTIYRWDINVRMATIIGLVGGGGLGNLLMQYQGQAKWNEVGLIVMVIAFIVWVMDYASARIREAIK